MPATKGVRNPALLSRPVQREERVPVAYVVATKPLRFGEHTLLAGTEIPGAADWIRLEAWISSRAVRPVYSGDVYVTFESFIESLDFSERVIELSHVLPDDEDEDDQE